MDEENIPFTVHLGKMVDLNPARITQMYGVGAISYIAAGNKVLDASAMNVFTNTLLQVWGWIKY